MGERNLRNRQLEPLRSRIGAAFAKSVTKREVGTVADRVAILAIPAESANGATEAPLLQEELERAQRVAGGQIGAQDLDWLSKGFSAFLANGGALPLRSEEHTSELQSRGHLVCRLLLDKKKKY